MRSAIVLVLVLAATARYAEGQQGRLEWQVRWGGADWKAGRYLILGDPISISAKIAVKNTGDEPISIGQPSAVRVVVREGPSMGELAVNCQSAALRQRAGSVEAVPVDAAVVLSPGDVATISCSVARTDGEALVSGRYAVDVFVDWPGVRERGQGPWKLEVRPPETAGEITRFHVLAGSRAMAADPRDLSAAIVHFRAAVVASPDAYWPLNSLAAAYDAAGRRAESIAARELALQKPGAIVAFRESRVPELLARAYLLEGDLANARRVLRLVGRPEADIDAFTRGSATQRR